ncbi:MAG: hypothetical protein KC656_26480, partial [Myxococcales bacterium]|nr:hypothetical protein [Myxococcales bacterium]
WGCTPPCVEPLVAPELRVDGTVVDVLTAGDARIQPPPPPDTVRYAFSHAGEPLWTVWRYPHRPDGALRVRRGRDEVLELVLP